MKVLVTGGTGLIGKPVVDHLLDAGHEVRMLSRHADRDAGLWAEPVEAHRGSVAEVGDVRGSAEGCEVVLHTVGIVKERPPEATFERINVQGTRNIVEECERAGVRRLVYLSSLGAARGTSDYHRSKEAGERAASEFSGDWLICRPGNVYGPGDDVLSKLLKMVRTLPAVPMVGDGSKPFQPIWVRDLAEALARAVERDDLTGRALDIAGLEPVTMNRILDLLEGITGKQPTRLPVPRAVAHGGAEALEALGFDAPVTADQITMLAEDSFIKEGEENALVTVFNITPTPLEDGLAMLADSLPEQLPEEGEGTLKRNRYWADIQGSELDADELFRVLRDDFYTLPAEGLLKVGVEPGSRKRPEVGATLNMSIPLRGTIQVRVEKIEDRTITCATVDGHFLSGVILFGVEERPERGALRVEIRSYARATETADRIAMGTVGETAQKATWNSVVEELVRRSGGAVPDGVQHSRDSLTGRDAERVERWAEEMVREGRREERSGPSA